MIFDLDEYSSNKYVMHCNTWEKAIIFTKYLHDHGMTWRGGASYIANDNWEHYGKDTCYRFNSGLTADYEYYRLTGARILEFDHFDWNIYNESTIDDSVLDEILEEL